MYHFKPNNMKTELQKEWAAFKDSVKGRNEPWKCPHLKRIDELIEHKLTEQTFDREKVMEIVVDWWENRSTDLADLVDSICSIALPTLDREKVMEMLTKQDENGNYWEILRYDRKWIGVDNLPVPYDGTEELADAICSISHVSSGKNVTNLSEVEIDKAAKKYLKGMRNVPFGADELVITDFTSGAEWAIKELTKKEQ